MFTSTVIHRWQNRSSGIRGFMPGHIVKSWARYQLQIFRQTSRPVPDKGLTYQDIMNVGI